MFGLGPWELAIIFLIVLVVFGPKSLPRVGQSLGKGIREFKDAASGLTKDIDEDEQRRAQIGATSQREQAPSEIRPAHVLEQTPPAPVPPATPQA